MLCLNGEIYEFYGAPALASYGTYFLVCSLDRSGEVETVDWLDLTDRREMPWATQEELEDAKAVWNSSFRAMWEKGGSAQIMLPEYPEWAESDFPD